ncbi:sigma 54 modulation/S30EA ribosomal C-terminal domain-containing protein, partial [Alphaproteobacteria bacterium]|nr:sigma 54 modulation/S30EA ribosomal C-terminal domain-containing protein [Alphaproteobacteria bacterium]
SSDFKPALMFRNVNHSGLNMIYKRNDGMIGWVDPRGLRSTLQI